MASVSYVLLTQFSAGIGRNRGRSCGNSVYRCHMSKVQHCAGVSAMGLRETGGLLYRDSAAEHQLGC